MSDDFIPKAGTIKIGGLGPKAARLQALRETGRRSVGWSGRDLRRTWRFVPAGMVGPSKVERGGERTPPPTDATRARVGSDVRSRELYRPRAGPRQS